MQAEAPDAAHDDLTAGEDGSVDGVSAKFCVDRKNEPETLTEARREKVLEETELIRIKIAKERGELISVEESDERDLRTGAIIKAMFMRASSDLTPMVVGLPADEVEEVIQQWAYERLEEVATEDPQKFRDGID